MALACGRCGCLETSCEPCTTVTICGNCGSCCCGAIHTSWRQIRILRGIRLEYLSNSWMAIEVAGAVLAGVLAGSFALLTFGADSFLEFLSGFVVLRHLKSDSKGSDAKGAGTARLTSVLVLSLIPVIGLSSLFPTFSGSELR